MGGGGGRRQAHQPRGRATPAKDPRRCTRGTPGCSRRLCPSAMESVGSSHGSIHRSNSSSGRGKGPWLGRKEGPARVCTSGLPRCTHPQQLPLCLNPSLELLRPQEPDPPVRLQRPSPRPRSRPQWCPANPSPRSVRPNPHAPSPSLPPPLPPSPWGHSLGRGPLEGLRRTKGRPLPGHALTLARGPAQAQQPKRLVRKLGWAGPRRRRWRI